MNLRAPYTRVEIVSRSRRGLTLMELLVVLTILVAVAAIMVPMFPNFLRRAHKAIDCTQTGEVNKAIQLYQASTYAYPDNFDSMLTSTGAYPTFLPGGNTAPFGGFTSIGTLTSDEVAALGRVGITSLQSMAAGPVTQPTLNPYPTASISADAMSLSGSGTSVCILNTTNVDAANPAFLSGDRQREAAALAAGKTTHAARYVVFGVGQRCSMVGQTIQDAPTSVPQDRNFTPDNTYCRVGVIFKVSGYEVDKTERARLIAAVALEDDELETTEKDIVGYYNVAGATQ